MCSVVPVLLTVKVYVSVSSANAVSPIAIIMTSDRKKAMKCFVICFFIRVSLLLFDVRPVFCRAVFLVIVRCEFVVFTTVIPVCLQLLCITFHAQVRGAGACPG